MIENLTLITGNAKKAEQIGRILKTPLPHLNIDLPEIQSLVLSEIVTKKAEEAFLQVKTPVLVEDVSLTFTAMGKLPGPLIKWFLQELGNEGLCQLVDCYHERDAIAEVAYGIHTGEKIHLFSATVGGKIAKTPRGDQHFGWNAIFIPEGFEKTWAEMSEEEQAQTSMRSKALRDVEHFLSYL